MGAYADVPLATQPGHSDQFYSFPKADLTGCLSRTERWQDVVRYPHDSYPAFDHGKLGARQGAVSEYLRHGFGARVEAPDRSWFFYGLSPSNSVVLNTGLRHLQVKLHRPPP